VTKLKKQEPSSLVPARSSEFILYQTEDGSTRIECRFEDETVWLTQAALAELYQTTPQNITQHVAAIYKEAELVEEATCKFFSQVRAEGQREVERALKHYSLPVILAVGYRVRSHRGTQFRQWATARLSEYLVKGFTMDDERLKNPPGPGQTDYFDELLERIRDIRSSERRFYQKVLDIYATSVDYAPDTEMSQQFFATVQNKMHWATHGHTAAEIIHERADASRPLMGLMTTRRGKPCATTPPQSGRRAPVCRAMRQRPLDRIPTLPPGKAREPLFRGGADRGGPIGAICLGNIAQPDISNTRKCPVGVSVRGSS
jgi:hypothetical protein